MGQLHFELGRQLWGSNPHLLKHPTDRGCQKMAESHKTDRALWRSGLTVNNVQRVGNTLVATSQRLTTKFLFYLCHLELVLPSGIVHLRLTHDRGPPNLLLYHTFKNLSSKITYFFKKNFFLNFEKLLDKLSQ